MSKKTRIVVVGAGFGGVKVVRELAKDKSLDITIVDRRNFHLFQPLLYQLATSLLSTDEIAYPIRSFFRHNKNVDLFMAKLRGLDRERKVVITNHGEIPYDYLVLAAGATTNFFGMESVEEHSFPMKTLQEALHIRNHVIHMFERANKIEHNEEERRRMLSFVVVGGGPTGVELAGSLAEVINLIMKDEYHNLSPDEISVKLVEATGGLLPMMPPDLQQETVRVLEKKGIDVMLNTQVAGCDKNSLILKDGRVIPTNTVIWAAGVKAVPIISKLGFACDRSGRVIVNEKLQVEGERDIFAIGDCASFCHGTERPLATVAPVATQGGVVAARNIKRLIAGDENLETFHYKDQGAMATIGRTEAVVNMNGTKMKGFIAWVVWMFVHLLRLAGAHTNTTVLLKWTWNLLSGTRLGRIITNMQYDESRELRPMPLDPEEKG